MTNILLIFLIGLVLLDILDREYVQLRAWFLRKKIGWNAKLEELRWRTRHGDDQAIAERLTKVDHVRKTPWDDDVIKRNHPEIWKMIMKQDLCIHRFEEFETHKTCKKCEISYLL